MSHKYQVVLPDPVSTQLQELAAGTGEPPSTLAGHFVCNAVAQAVKDGKVRPLRQARPIVGAGKSVERARWLEPWGGDADWRTDMWGQIVALYGRYSRALGSLKDGWWMDDQHTEVLCALALWRAEIDDAGVDPREELAFHAQLDDFAQKLRQEGGGVTKAWKPGGAPAQWAGE